GGIYADVSGSNNTFDITNQVQIDECESQLDGGVQFENSESFSDGGAIYAVIRQFGDLQINRTKFIGCKSTSGKGGGIFVNQSNSYSSLQLTNQVEFTNCNSSLEGGAMYSIVANSSTLKLSKITFDNCKSLTEKGGGIYTEISQTIISPIQYDEIQMNQCQSDLNGGGFYAIITNQGKLSIRKTSLNGCISKSGKGGGIYTEISGIGSLIQISDQVKFIECESQDNVGSGGGLCSIIEKSGKLSISQNCYFTDCKCTSGNGGGMYIEMKSLGVVNIQNQVYFSHCKALQSKQFTPPTGYGGAIFLLIYDNLDITQNNINLKGALFNQNEAQNKGH
ncbi:MAG: hypothetical protein EZS28_046034, partial [Streblomastix strix]